MKVWELEEGKIYKIKNHWDYRVKDKRKINTLQTFETATKTWEDINLSLDAIKNWDFEEVVDTNSHWKPCEERISFIRTDFNSAIISKVFMNYDMNDSNMFHVDDKKKVECLALEFKIKSVLLNWRRLHDDVELDYNDNKWYILYWDGVYLTKSRSKTSSAFGYFSSKEKAQQFYDYMKDDVDKYFKMRKELKF